MPSYEEALAEKQAQRGRKLEDLASRRAARLEAALETTPIDWQRSLEEVEDFGQARQQARAAAEDNLRRMLAAAKAP